MRVVIEIFAALVLGTLAYRVRARRIMWEKASQLALTQADKYDTIAKTVIRVFRNPDGGEGKGVCIMETTLDNLILAIRYRADEGGEGAYDLMGGSMDTAYGTIRLELQPSWKRTEVVDEED